MAAPVWLATAFAALDDANGADPTLVQWRGALVPKARLQGERATFWLNRLAPDASVAVQLAARGHHLRRFALPRAQFDDGRVGYRRWRAAQKEALSSSLTEVLAPGGVEPAVIERAIQLAQREGLGADPETQLVEDAACLVFCETDLADLADRIGQAKTVEAIRKTLPKMSPAAIALAPEATPPGAAQVALTAAVS
jgi:hypothetical protein